MYKFLYSIKEASESLSFWGGIVSSFGCTIVYEAICKIPLEHLTIPYILEWVSAILMMVACVLFILLSSKVSRINEKFVVLLSCATDSEKNDPSIILKLAVKNAFNLGDLQSTKKQVYLLFAQFFLSVLLTLSSFVILFISRFL